MIFILLFKFAKNSCCEAEVGKETTQFKGVYINGSNGKQQHINCCSKTTTKDLKILMAKLWKIKPINIFFFYHDKPLLDNTEVGGYLPYSL